MMRIFLRLLPCLAIALLASCSTYNRRFAEASRADVKHLLHEGAYAGRWTSAQNSAWDGNLRCILAKLNDTDFNAEFHATWHGLSSTHTVVLHTKPAPRKARQSEREFEGTSKLRTLIGAGTYTCKGTMDNRTMHACYDATYDRGTFELHRVNTPRPGR